MLMKRSLLIAGVFCFLCTGYAHASPRAGAAAAPEVRCEIRLSAWCIEQGAYEITRTLARDSVHDRVWSLNGQFRPRSKLIILEPNGCKSGFSNALALLKYEHDIEWHSQSWDGIIVRLKSDGSCDLTILFPLYESDPMEWAFTSGLPLVRPCKDNVCDSAGLVQLKAQIEQKFKEGI
jgi:hypothetical protein